eukprot:TRINITY_DN1039_c0_g4_i1.p1 TRINITY_DN1039_c0_g4~~TRINITY_DN1039_c0_g4_i1.p1  ORF type:complete len:791 (+),score=248.94 TRINITY_DN1039_c0_g4_i1:95-2467(+)
MEALGERRVPLAAAGLAAAAAVGAAASGCCGCRCGGGSRRRRRLLQAGLLEAVRSGNGPAVRDALSRAAAPAELAEEVLELALEAGDAGVFAAAVRHAAPQRALALLLRAAWDPLEGALVDAALTECPQLAALASPDGWTLAAAAAAGGCAWALAAAICSGARLTEPAGLPPLCAAASNGRAHCVRLLLAKGAPVHQGLPDDGGTPLQLAAQGSDSGCEDAVRLLLAAGADPSAPSGRLRQPPLYSAARTGARRSCRWLLAAGADPLATRRDGATALHAAAAKGHEGAVQEILVHAKSRGVVHEVLFARDQYGQTALHCAASHLRVRVCEQLVYCGGAPSPGAAAAPQTGGEGEQSIVCARDHDGATPLIAVIRTLAVQSGGGQGGLDEGAVQSAEKLVGLFREATSDADDEGATPLHCAACVQGAAASYIISALVRHGADPSREDATGWTPVHLSNARGHDVALAALRVASTPEFLRDFDPAKERQKPPPRPPPQIAAVPEADRHAVLGGVTSMAAIAARLRDGRSRKVVALVGAGVSTASGIPDYRSEGSGIYTKQQAFSVESLLRDPEGFYKVAAKTFFAPDLRPNVAHRLLAVMAERGLLLRVYTQNIDELEERAGVAPELVVYCHGSFRSFSCLDDSCRRPPIAAGSPEAEAARREVRKGRVPRCPCGSPLRPDVVFFGEPLPREFEKRHEDFANADLLLVMGTSLQVYPFAALTQEVGPLCPRLLLNRVEVGPWRGRSEALRAFNYRDVCFLGDCVDGARALAAAAGWLGELEPCSRTASPVAN